MQEMLAEALEGVAVGSGKLSVLPFTWFYERCIEKELWSFISDQLKPCLSFLDPVSRIVDCAESGLTCGGLIDPLDLQYLAQAVNIIGGGG